MFTMAQSLVTKRRLLLQIGGLAVIIFGATHLVENMMGVSRDLYASQAEPTTRKPFSAYIDPINQTLRSNVQELLHFAVIGNPKTGTTFLQNRLYSHPEISVHGHELRLLRENLTAMAEALYELDPSKKRGYKDPGDIQRRVVLDAIYQYWPETKLVVGLRHPIRHFESYYNFRARQGQEVPPLDDLVGSRLYDQSIFHRHLAGLGKTELQNGTEMDLLNHSITERPPRMSNPLFLYIESQLFDKEEGRNWQLARDLQAYLGLTSEIIIEREQTMSRYWRRFVKFIQGKRKVRRTSPQYHAALNICDNNFTHVREALLAHSLNASRWIREYLLTVPEVTVSDPDHFVSLLKTWETDPCEEEEIVAISR